MTTTIVHITDCHLLGLPEARLHGWPVAATFEHVLATATATYPAFDALVLGGDLVDDESEAGYRRLNAQLAALRRPVLAVAGNHDDPARMRALLTAAHVHEPVDIGDRLLIGLNSHVEDSAAGRLGARQLQRLDKQLAATKQPTLVVLHHPAWATGSAWMDAMGLSDRHALTDILARHPHVTGVLCGHAHQAQTYRRAGWTGWITPSTMRQFAPGAAEFATDTTRDPGYRCLVTHADGRIDSRLHRVPMPASIGGS